MSSTSVAVFGYGTVGKPLVSALAAQGAGVLLLSRDASKPQGVPSGVQTASVDYNDETQVADTLKQHGVDAVVITLGGSADAEHVLTVVQVSITRAAKAAGVKLFMPSEFGIDTEGYGLGSSGAFSKQRVRYLQTARIQEIGIPTTRVLAGWFTEIIPWLTSSTAKPDKFIITGKGDREISFTAVSDLVGYVAHILTSIPLPELYNKSLLIEGQAAIFQEVAQILGKKITHVSPEEVEQPFVRILLGLADKGRVRIGYISKDADVSQEVVDKRSSEGNELWKGHQWKQIKDVYAV